MSLRNGSLLKLSKAPLMSNKPARMCLLLDPSIYNLINFIAVIVDLPLTKPYWFGLSSLVISGSILLIKIDSKIFDITLSRLIGL